ncbi:hypothetical protein P3102_20775 [Amycolatopsis sp. QT-25]|uniref:hypothetical protein n=1 Tax=Amycolatopsis sp. QT-25 TaxID=3034022 RepID=UPI0023ED3D34|nr:hypothetical protein [Amycolatopsis sp. QT-25]WET76559.1 hypothetical protein P3102_20775 [Amycolatopsis sp. QT-25]
MRAWSRRWIALGAGAGCLLAGTVVAVVLLTDHAEPELDEDLWRAVAPVVHAELPANRKHTWPGSPAGRWFCAERAVETRRDGSDVRVGLIANCSEYVGRDGVLVQSSGRSGALVVTLASGPDGYRVRDIEAPVDGAGHDESLRRMFSTAGYEEVRRSASRAGPDPAPEARAALGLPADAPVVLR